MFTLLIAFFAVVSLAYGVWAAPAKVESVDVKVVDVTGAADQTVLERMASSMKVVAQQIMLGKSVDYVTEGKATYQGLLQDISDRVFAGYSTERVALQTGDAVAATIYVAPWAAVVKDVRVNIYLSGMDASWQLLLEEDIGALRSEIKKTLKGVSVDSVDWAATIIKDRVRDVVAEKLPEFKAAVDVAGGETVSVDITLIPVGNNVQAVRFELKSDTMPSLVLLDARKRLEERVSQIRGLPVDFVAAHKVRIENILKEEVEKERIVKNYDLAVDVDIVPKVSSVVTITLDSGKYRVWIEGYVDIGRDDNNLSGRMHAGRLLSGKDEIFVEVSLFTENVSWKFDPGISHRWGNTKLSFLYRLPDDESIVRLEYDFARNWRLRAEKYGHIDRPEFALRYRIHEFLAVEIVLGAEKENYLRIVGNL